MPPGVAGELVIRGPHVMQGYWDNDEATAKALRPGPNPWEKVLYTGDLFRTDEEGFLYFVGRKDDIIKTRGEKVAPKEVESGPACLSGHRAKPSSSACPIRCSARRSRRSSSLVRSGARPSATSSATARSISKTSWCRNPSSSATSLPKTDTGKVSRRLAAEITGGRRMNDARPVPATAFSAETLAIDPEAETERIVEALREQVRRHCSKRGAGARPFRRHRFQRLGGAWRRAPSARRTSSRCFMPENDSDPESLRLGRMVAETFGIDERRSRISGRRSHAMGCYERRDAFIRATRSRVRPRLGLQDRDRQCARRRRLRHLLARRAGARRQDRRKLRMPPSVYLGIVAATNMKQRTRKQLEYYHADRLNFAVIGTPNRLEYDQGFFVKNGDGAADVKPIAHLYKIAGLSACRPISACPRRSAAGRRRPTPIRWRRRRRSSTSRCPMTGWISASMASTTACRPMQWRTAAGLTAEQVQRVWRDIAAKRKATRYLHAGPLLVEPVVIEH